MSKIAYKFSSYAECAYIIACLHLKNHFSDNDPNNVFIDGELESYKIGMVIIDGLGEFFVVSNTFKQDKNTKLVEFKDFKFENVPDFKRINFLLNDDSDYMVTFSKNGDFIDVGCQKIDFKDVKKIYDNMVELRSKVETVSVKKPATKKPPTRRVKK